MTDPNDTRKSAIESAMIEAAAIANRRKWMMDAAREMNRDLARGEVWERLCERDADIMEKHFQRANGG